MATSFLSALSGRLAGLLGMDLLFGAMLPVVIIGFAWFCLFAVVTGVGGTVDILATLSPAIWAGATAVLGLLLLTWSYALVAFRPLLLEFWSGQALRTALAPVWSLLASGKATELEALESDIEQPATTRAERLKLVTKLVNARRREGLKDNARECSQENKAPEVIRWLGRKAASRKTIATAACDIEKLCQLLKLEVVAKQIGTSAALDEVLALLGPWAMQETVAERAARARRANEFATAELLAPTRLGNLVNATDYYAFDRYGIEGTVLLPRLVAVLPAAIAERLADQRLLLDFWIAVASLALLSTLIVAFGFAHVSADVVLWLLALTIGSAGTVAAYRLAVGAMAQLGELTRAACDLGRLALMRELGLPQPADLAEERRMWQAMFRVIVYGEKNEDIRYRAAEKP